MGCAAALLKQSFKDSLWERKAPQDRSHKHPAQNPTPCPPVSFALAPCSVHMCEPIQVLSSPVLQHIAISLRQKPQTPN